MNPTIAARGAWRWRAVAVVLLGVLLAAPGPAVAGPGRDKPVVGGPAIDSCYLVCDSPAVVRSGTPRLSAVFSSPVGAIMRGEFRVHDRATGARVADSGTAVTGVPSGQRVQWGVVPSTGETLPDGTYRWRVRACDDHRCGRYSPWFTFTVNTGSVPAPTVSGTPYLEKSTGTWNGGVGVPGQFTFGPNGSSDVAEYAYSMNGGNVVTLPAGSSSNSSDLIVIETIVPVRDGLNVLTVQSRNSAGTTSEPTRYQFLVTPSTSAWEWLLEEGTGATAGSNPDTAPAAFSDSGVSWLVPGRVGAGAVTLDGTGDMTTASGVLDATHPAGLTVAAWVRLDGGTASRTAISQDGVHTSMFRLGYRDDHDVTGDGAADPAWCFTMAIADESDADEAAACVTDFVAVGEWVSLVGVYDRPTGKVKVYVNGGFNLGGAAAEVDYQGGGWPAAGPFAMGRGWTGGPVDRWIGGLDHVKAAQRVWGDAEILQHAFQ